jgi:hypothetical protein
MENCSRLKMSKNPGLLNTMRTGMEGVLTSDRSCHEITKTIGEL